MTDEEWEHIEPLVEAYHAASEARADYESVYLNMCTNSMYRPITRAAIEAIVIERQTAQRVEFARSELENKCEDIFRVRVNV